MFNSRQDVTADPKKLTDSIVVIAQQYVDMCMKGTVLLLYRKAN